MSIQLIDKIKQKNDGNFYLVDAVDVEYNKKSLIDALKAGDIIPAGGGTSAGTFHVANINIGSNTAFDSSKLTPSTVSAGDLIVDANGAFYTVAKVDGTTVTPSAALTADGGGTLGFKGAKGDKGEPGEQGEKGANGTPGAKGETGQRGNRITVGDGDPGEPPADALAGDVYINQANGDFYQVQDQ